MYDIIIATWYHDYTLCPSDVPDVQKSSNVCVEPMRPAVDNYLLLLCAPVSNVLHGERGLDRSDGAAAQRRRPQKASPLRSWTRAGEHQDYGIIVLLVILPKYACCRPVSPTKPNWCCIIL